MPSEGLNYCTEPPSRARALNALLPGSCQTETALLPAPFWCTYAWNRPTSTGAGGSDPLWLCWRGKPWLAIRWRGYAASKWSQLERQLILGQRLLPIATIAASAHTCGANAAHGFPRSNEDKRRAVLKLLNDAEWSHWSNCKIAKQCCGFGPLRQQAAP